MRTRALLFGAAICFAGLASAQDSFSFERKYTLNDKDTYAFKMSFSVQGMSIDVTVSSVQKVAKVYDNGDADIESEVVDMKVLMNGSEMPNPGGGAVQKKTSMRMDKFGMPVVAADAAKSAATGGRGQGIGGAEVMRYFNLGTLKSMKVGQTVDINYTDPQDKDRTVKGTAVLESLADGVAKVVANVNVTGKGLQKPMAVHMTSFMDTATAKANKVEGTINGLAGGPMPIDNAQFSIVRQKG